MLRKNYSPTQPQNHNSPDTNPNPFHELNQKITLSHLSEKGKDPVTNLNLDSFPSAQILPNPLGTPKIDNKNLTRHNSTSLMSLNSLKTYSQKDKECSRRNSKLSKEKTKKINPIEISRIKTKKF